MQIYSAFCLTSDKHSYLSLLEQDRELALPHGFTRHWGQSSRRRIWLWQPHCRKMDEESCGEARKNKSVDIKVKDLTKAWRSSRNGDGERRQIVGIFIVLLAQMQTTSWSWKLIWLEFEWIFHVEGGEFWLLKDSLSLVHRCPAHGYSTGLSTVATCPEKPWHPHPPLHGKWCYILTPAGHCKSEQDAPWVLAATVLGHTFEY